MDLDKISEKYEYSDYCCRCGEHKKLYKYFQYRQECICKDCKDDLEDYGIRLPLQGGII